MIVYIVILMTLINYVLNSEIDNNCIFFYGPSSIQGTGRGIFAGINIDPFRSFELEPTLLIHKKYYSRWSIKNYVYGYNDDYSMLVIGMAMIYNHHEILVNTHHIWVRDENEKELSCHLDDSEAFSTCNRINYHSNKHIEIGEEIFAKFGGSEWFIKRNIPYDINDNLNESTSRRFLPIDYLKTNYFCLSNTFIDLSTISNAGYGLFARKKFVKGEIVTISPVLFVPLHELLQSDSIIINYSIGSSSLGDVAIIPFGVGIMINHKIKPLSNVVIEWKSFDNLVNVTDILNIHPDVLEKSHFAPIDISFIATKTIYPNEEIFLDYGNEWMAAWISYMNQLNLFNSNLCEQKLNSNECYENSDFFSDEKPKFRHPIQPPHDFFPKFWNNIHCIGSLCDPSDNEID